VHAERIIQGMLAFVTACGIALAARLLLASDQSPDVPVAAAVAGAPGVPAPVRRDSLVQVVTARNPFRVDRSVAAAAFNPQTAAGAAPAPPAPPRPTLILAGILSGPEPAALIDGIPGQGATRVLRVGERAGDFVVRSIADGQVVVAGRDTVMTLRLRNTFR